MLQPVKSGPPSLADEAFAETPHVPDSPHSSAALQHGRGPRLYVGGVHGDITEEDVKLHFSRWGRVLDVYFPGMVYYMSLVRSRCGDLP